jgi:predicted nucleotide-binding protein
VVVLSGDDEARLRVELRQEVEPGHETELTPQARPNVLFEAGMAMAHNPDRTVIVEFGNLRPFSDVGGRHTIRMDGSSEKRQELATRLQNAGCTVKMAGTDWHTAGDPRPSV